MGLLVESDWTHGFVAVRHPNHMPSLPWIQVPGLRLAQKRGESLVAECLNGIQACGSDGRDEAADDSHEDQHQGGKGHGADVQ